MGDERYCETEMEHSCQPNAKCKANLHLKLPEGLMIDRRHTNDRATVSNWRREGDEDEIGVGAGERRLVLHHNTTNNNPKEISRIDVKPRR